MYENPEDVAALLRKLADAIERGEVGEWDVRVRTSMVDVSTPGERHFVPGGESVYTIKLTAAVDD